MKKATGTSKDNCTSNYHAECKRKTALITYYKNKDMKNECHD